MPIPDDIEDALFIAMVRAFPTRPCPCGSGKDSNWEYDARGIEIARVCEDCRGIKLRGYRPEVLDDPDYIANEPIEEDE